MSAEKRVVVTGGSGFIGRRLVAALEQRAVRVTNVDLRPFPGPVSEDIVGDLTDPKTLDRVFRNPPDGVLHLAARTSVVQSAADPAGVFTVNVGVTQNLLEACRTHGVKSFVLTSTNAVAGNATPASGKLSEAAVLRPLTAYGATKAAGEMLCSAYGQSYGMAVAAVRLTNVYGPGMSGKDGFVVRLLRAAVRGTTIRIHAEGALQRDYVYVDDAVAGLILAWEKGHSGPLVIGSGESINLLEVHRAACKVTGKDIPVEHHAGPPGEMKAVRVDLALAKSLGYAPAFDFTQGMAATWQAMRDELMAEAR